MADTLREQLPSWTEIMERTGTEIPKHPRSELKRKNKFKYSEFRKKIRYDPIGKCENAFKIAVSPENLKLSYDLIKSKPGNMVRGTDKQTLDGLPKT